MSEEYGRYIPKYLDAQPQFLWWEADEAMILAAGVVAGIMLEKMLIFIPLGVIIQKIYSSLRNAKQEGYMKHIIYKIGLLNPSSNKIKKLKIPFFYIKFYVR